MTSDGVWADLEIKQAQLLLGKKGEGTEDRGENARECPGQGFRVFGHLEKLSAALRAEAVAPGQPGPCVSLAESLTPREAVSASGYTAFCSGVQRPPGEGTSSTAVPLLGPREWAQSQGPHLFLLLLGSPRVVVH